MHAAFAVANAFEKVRNSMANGMKGFFGRALPPEKFGERMRRAGREDEAAAKARSFASLMPLAANPREYYCLMLAINERPVLAGEAAEGDRYSLNQLKTTIRYSAKRNMRESEVFARHFQAFFGGGIYAKDDDSLGIPAVALDEEHYLPLMKLNEPIAGAYRQLSRLMESATLYFSTQTSGVYAGMVASAWKSYILDLHQPQIREKLGNELALLLQDGILDADFHGPQMLFKINVPTDVRLLADGQGKARLFPDRAIHNRLLALEQGDRVRHAQAVFEREALPHENIWLLEGSYSRQKTGEFARCRFRNVIVVEGNPRWKWNYDEARRDGVRVLGMESLAGDLAAIMFAEASKC